MRFSNEMENQVKTNNLFYQGQIIGKGIIFQNFSYTYNVRIISGNNNLQNISVKEYYKNIPVIGFDPTVDPGLQEGDIVFLGFINKDTNCPYILSCNNFSTSSTPITNIENNIGETEQYDIDTSQICASVADLQGITFIWPDPKCIEITDVFGKRGPTRNHHGIDIGSLGGNEIIAAHSGKVVLSERTAYSGGYGEVVDILSDNGKIRSRYAHGKERLVKLGEEVKAGQQILISGDTGSPGSFHLHFEIGYMDTLFIQCNPRLMKYNITPTLRPGISTIESNETMKTNYIRNNGVD